MNQSEINRNFAAVLVERGLVEAGSAFERLLHGAPTEEVSWVGKLSTADTPEGRLHAVVEDPVWEKRGLQDEMREALIEAVRRAHENL